MSTYAVSDLHGHLELWEEIEKFLKPDDKVYVLGDCGDRGPQPWETIKAVYKNPQVAYLMSNHEKMLIDAAKDMDYYEYMGSKFELLIYNGGMETFSGWLAEENERTNWRIRLEKLPQITHHTNKDGIDIILCHSGDLTDLLWGRDFNIPLPVEINPQTVVIHGHTPCQYVSKDLNEEWDGGAFWYNNNTRCCLDQGTIKTKQVCLLDLDTFDEHIFCL